MNAYSGEVVMRHDSDGGASCPCVIRQKDGSLLVKLHVQPRAGSNGIAGLHDDALKLRLTTPPVDGKANKAVLAFCARLFGVPKSRISLKSGHKSRSKTILVEGVDADAVEAVLAEYLNKRT